MYVNLKHGPFYQSYGFSFFRMILSLKRKMLYFYFQVLLTQDETFISVLGTDKNRKNECILVYHAKRGTYVHKIPLK